jgi:hypothetical protein
VGAKLFFDIDPSTRIDVAVDAPFSIRAALKGTLADHPDTEVQWVFNGKNEPGPSSESAEEYADPADLAGTGGGGHFANFIHALRTGDRAKLTSDIEEGFVSTALPHLANIAYRTGAVLTFDGATERFTGHMAGRANRLLSRDYREPYVVPRHV